MHPAYDDWLRRAVPTEATWRTKLSELRRVESAYGDLDALYDLDELANLLDELTYSTEDARNNRPNPSKLNIGGDLRNNLASYKSAVQKYARFRQDVELEAARPAIQPLRRPETGEEASDEITFSLEKDLQKALRGNIAQLEDGLTIVDGGSEQTVASGRIDILARDAQGRDVVIELKAVEAQVSVVGQIASYMGDRAAAGAKDVRGIIVAPDFHTKLVSASRVTPNIRLVQYSFSFRFSPVAQ